MSAFDRYWQMIAWSREISSNPIVRVVGGVPILLYRTEQGSVVALDDRCPHRFAPLHRGRRVGDGIACPYHGLVFDSSGQCVRNPHGSHVIPPLAKVRRYEVKQQQDAVWIWCGDPAASTAASVPDHPERDPGSGLRTNTGYLRVHAHFSLVIDNLLDLTHAGYLHPGTVSVPAEERQPEIASGVEDGVVYSRFITRDVVPPGPFRRHFAGDIGDYHRFVRWYEPAIVKTTIGFAPSGRPLAEGIYFEGYHLLTPEDNLTTHYFWSTSRDFALADERYDAGLTEMIDKAFMTEDEPMIAACQRYMGTTDLFSLHPALLETDRASVLVHHRMKRLGIIGSDAPSGDHSE